MSDQVGNQNVGFLMMWLIWFHYIVKIRIDMHIVRSAVVVLSVASVDVSVGTSSSFVCYIGFGKGS